MAVATLLHGRNLQAWRPLEPLKHALCFASIAAQWVNLRPHRELRDLLVLLEVSGSVGVPGVHLADDRRPYLVRHRVRQPAAASKRP